MIGAVQANLFGVPTVAALFVDGEGLYSRRFEVDAWDEARDARRYTGSAPVVAHPPCSRWGKLAKLVQARWGYQVGEDGGCFESALASVRRCGGVLEHPAWTMAWERFGLRKPRRGEWLESAPGEWVTEVNQAAYGHPATKRTWLLYCGKSAPPPLDWSNTIGGMVVGHCKRNGDGSVWRDNARRIGKKPASATPPDFLDALVALALHSTKPPPPADWWAHALPDYAAKGGFEPILIDPPEEDPPGLERVTHAEVVALRGAP